MATGILAAFQAAPFARFFANSFAYSVVCTLSVLTTSLVAGSVFGKYRFPLRGLLFGLMLATAIVAFLLSCIGVLLAEGLRRKQQDPHDRVRLANL